MKIPVIILAFLLLVTDTFGQGVSVRATNGIAVNLSMTGGATADSLNVGGSVLVNGAIVYESVATNLPLTIDGNNNITNVPSGTNGNFVIADSSKLGGTKFVSAVNLAPAFQGQNITGLNLNITNISGISTNGLVITNVAFALNTAYTNTFGYVAEVAGITVKFVEGVLAGQCALTVSITNGVSVTNYSVNALTVLGQAAGLTTTNSFVTFFVPVGATFGFSDTSAGSGNSVVIIGGTEAYFSEVIAQGALSAALSALNTNNGGNLTNLPAFSLTVNPAPTLGPTNFTFNLGGTNSPFQRFLFTTNGNICLSNFTGTLGDITLCVYGTNSVFWPTNIRTIITNGINLSGSNWVWHGGNAASTFIANFSSWSNNASLSNITCTYQGN